MMYILLETYRFCMKMANYFQAVNWKGDTMKRGRFGEFGGQYVPETLMNAVKEVEEAYEHYKNDPEFVKELDGLMKNYAGRPSLLYYAEKNDKGFRWGKNLFKERRFESYRFS